MDVFHINYPCIGFVLICREQNASRPEGTAMLTPQDQCWVMETVDRWLERSYGLGSLLQDQWSSVVCLTKWQSHLMLKAWITAITNHLKLVAAMAGSRTAWRIHTKTSVDKTFRIFITVYYLFKKWAIKHSSYIKPP